MARKNPRPTNSMTLPGGRTISLERESVKERKDGRLNASLWVAVRRGSPAKIEARAGKYAKEVLYDLGYIVGHIKAAIPIIVPSPVGPVPFARRGWVPVRVLAVVREDPNFGDDDFGA